MSFLTKETIIGSPINEKTSLLQKNLCFHEGKIYLSINGKLYFFENDQSSLRWMEIPFLPFSIRKGQSMTSTNRGLVCFGGLCEDSSSLPKKNEIFFNDMWLYSDGKESRWTFIPCKVEPRAFHSACAGSSPDTIIISGGMGSANNIFPQNIASNADPCSSSEKDSNYVFFNDMYLVNLVTFVTTKVDFFSVPFSLSNHLLTHLSNFNYKKYILKKEKSVSYDLSSMSDDQIKDKNESIKDSSKSNIENDEAGENEAYLDDSIFCVFGGIYSKTKETNKNMYIINFKEKKTLLYKATYDYKHIELKYSFFNLDSLFIVGQSTILIFNFDHRTWIPLNLDYLNFQTNHTNDFPMPETKKTQIKIDRSSYMPPKNGNDLNSISREQIKLGLLKKNKSTIEILSPKNSSMESTKEEKSLLDPISKRIRSEPPLNVNESIEGNIDLGPEITNSLTIMNDGSKLNIFVPCFIYQEKSVKGFGSFYIIDDFLNFKATYKIILPSALSVEDNACMDVNKDNSHFIEFLKRNLQLGIESTKKINISSSDEISLEKEELENDKASLYNLLINSNLKSKDELEEVKLLKDNYEKLNKKLKYLNKIKSSIAQQFSNHQQNESSTNAAENQSDSNKIDEIHKAISLIFEQHNYKKSDYDLLNNECEYLENEIEALTFIYQCSGVNLPNVSDYKSRSDYETMVLNSKQLASKIKILNENEMSEIQNIYGEMSHNTQSSKACFYTNYDQLLKLRQSRNSLKKKVIDMKTNYFNIINELFEIREKYFSKNPNTSSDYEESCKKYIVDNENKNGYLSLQKERNEVFLKLRNSVTGLKEISYSNHTDLLKEITNSLYEIDQWTKNVYDTFSKIKSNNSGNTANDSSNKNLFERKVQILLNLEKSKKTKKSPTFCNNNLIDNLNFSTSRFPKSIERNSGSINEDSMKIFNNIEKAIQNNQ